MEIFVLREDQQFGPYSKTEFLKLMNDGNVVGTDLAWTAEWGDAWLVATEAEKRIHRTIAATQTQSRPEGACNVDMSAVRAEPTNSSETNERASVAATILAKGIQLGLFVFFVGIALWGARDSLSMFGGYSGPIHFCEEPVSIGKCKKNTLVLECNITFPPNKYASSFRARMGAWAYDKDGVQLEEMSTNMEIPGGATERVTLLSLSHDMWREVAEIRICSANPRSILGNSLAWKKIQ